MSAARPPADTEALAARAGAAAATVRDRLLEARDEDGRWTGRLSTSALSTATAALALELLARAREASGVAGGPWRELAEGGVRWLVAQQNSDGGWGDTARSRSNISTTTLAWATLGALDPGGRRTGRTQDDAAAWIRRRAGGVEPGRLAATILAVYGEDRTFSVPILTHCALAGRLGEGAEAWDAVPALPFELAALPSSWYRFAGLPVVSYALPALIAMGRVHHARRPPRRGVARLLRALAAGRTDRVLDRIQPSSGGFLEATPLTSFVLMSLVGAGLDDGPVARRAASFLRDSVRSDGGWPIDTNLANWVTTLAVNALAELGPLPDTLGAAGADRMREGLLRGQHRVVHPYTGASPGGWAWTDLPGGVPDADDTAGACLALARLGRHGPETVPAAARGARWLRRLQNRDGGIPTFCRGWGKLPFDRSGPDLTAHAVRAWAAWRNAAPLDGRVPGDLASGRLDRPLRRALRYLRSTQRPDGSWTPLWFGNEHAPGLENSVYGTARVVTALAELARAGLPSLPAERARGLAWLAGAQGPDGGHGGAAGVPPSVEETGLAVEALAAGLESDGGPSGVFAALGRGTRWLADAVASGRLEDAAPIGFYFANLWYFERLYPTVFALGGLARARRVLS